MQELLKDPIDISTDAAHTAASVSVLDRLARRLALIAAMVSPLLPLMSLPVYVSDERSLLPIIHLLVVLAAVATGLFRGRLSAGQIAWIFFTLMSVITLAAVSKYGTRTPLVLLPSFAVVALAVFTSRKATLIAGPLLMLGVLVITLYVRFASEYPSSYGLTIIWAEIGAWVGGSLLCLTLAAGVLSKLVRQLEVANASERREREHRFLAERGAQSSEQLLQKILDNAPVGITVLDDRGDVIGWNKTNEAFLKFSSEQMLNTSVCDFLRRADQSHPLIAPIEGLYTGQPFANLMFDVPTDQGVATLWMSGNPIFDEAGRVSGGITIGIDVTPVLGRFSANQPDAAAEEVANLAHDIRSPLMALGLSMESLDILLNAEHPDLDRIRQKLPVIMQQQIHAAEVVESYYESLRQRSAAQSAQDPERLTESAVDVLRASLTGLGIAVEVDATLAAGVPFATQAVLVRQVLINLMSNARDALLARADSGEFAPKIRITVEAMTDTIIWSVEDNGGGQLPPDPEILFARGFTTKPVGEGTGMGLFISRATASHLGGALVVAQGREGLMFQLRLPRQTGDD